MVVGRSGIAVITRDDCCQSDTPSVVLDKIEGMSQLTFHIAKSNSMLDIRTYKYIRNFIQWLLAILKYMYTRTSV